MNRAEAASVEKTGTPVSALCDALITPKLISNIYTIRLILSNGDSNSDILLTTWGKLEGFCQTYIVPAGQYIKTV